MLVVVVVVVVVAKAVASWRLHAPGHFASLRGAAARPGEVRARFGACPQRA